jgi:SWI/SNF-related matrix-associated actin-dependent regulator 1 of chromatin subfamily A
VTSMIPMQSQIQDSQTGKTGTAILAADLVLAKTILVVTTASGRGVWRAAFPAWSAIPRVVRVLGSDPSGQTDVGIVSWGQLAAIPGAIGARPDLIILDEHHRACNPEAQRTEHTFGRVIDDGKELATRRAIVTEADRVWLLSGTPIPHDLGNIWIAMRALFPERLAATKKLPDVSTYGAFRARYCIMGMKKLSNGQRIPIVLNGKNGDELRGRLEGTFLRRTQADVGIRPPRYEILPLIVSPADRREIMKVPNERKILAAAEAGKTHELEMELGRLRHVTGLIKARAVASAVKEEFENGLEKIVLAYWHRDVGDVLETLLQPHGVVRLDGSTLPHAREQVEKRFRIAGQQGLPSADRGRLRGDRSEPGRRALGCRIRDLAAADGSDFEADHERRQGPELLHSGLRDRRIDRREAAGDTIRRSPRRLERRPRRDAHRADPSTWPALAGQETPHPRRSRS